MKKNITKWLWASVALLTLSACGESDYDIDNLFPEQYAKILNIRNSGEQATTLYSTGNELAVPVTVMKSGSDVSATAQATLKVLSKAEINEKVGSEDNPYTPIPSNLYSVVNNELSFASEDRWKQTEIRFPATSVTEISNLLSDNPDGKKYVVGLELVSSSDSVNTQNNYVLVYINAVETPVYGLSATQRIVEAGSADINSPIEVSLNVDNLWDFTADVEVGTQADVDAYNRLTGLGYKLLPTDKYTIADKVVFASGSQGKIDFTANISSLAKTDAYLLPVRIKADGTAAFPLLDDKATYYLFVNPVRPAALSRSGWTFNATSEDQ